MHLEHVSRQSVFSTCKAREPAVQLGTCHLLLVARTGASGLQQAGELVGREQIEGVDVAVGEIAIPAGAVPAGHDDDARRADVVLDQQAADERYPVEDLEADLPEERADEHGAV